MVVKNQVSSAPTSRNIFCTKNQSSFVQIDKCGFLSVVSFYIVALETSVYMYYICVLLLLKNMTIPSDTELSSPLK